MNKYAFANRNIIQFQNKYICKQYYYVKRRKKAKCYVVMIKVCKNNNILKMFSNMITDEESRKGYVYDIC